jgi:hypothetical protein
LVCPLQLTQENEELRKGLPEYARLKAMYESLKQDHEALKTSLDSSERIRFQQKELIQVLQRSNNMGVDSSAASVQSISSISQKGDVSSMHSLAALIGSQPTNSVLSGYQGHGGDTPQWYGDRIFGYRLHSLTISFTDNVGFTLRRLKTMHHTQSLPIRAHRKGTGTPPP